jgi:protein TonB
VAGISFGVVLLIKEFSSQEPVKQVRQVQKVTLLKPPPPPPPPPKVERPPEPEVEEKVDMPEPELEELPEMANEPPLGDTLGLDAEGAAGSDGFGLIARKGGRGLLSSDPKVVYASKLQRLIEDALLNNELLRKRAYSVIALIWVTGNGAITRAELARTSGHREIDEKLVSLMTAMHAVAGEPPDSMPQPIKLRITSRI